MTRQLADIELCDRVCLRAYEETIVSIVSTESLRYQQSVWNESNLWVGLEYRLGFTCTPIPIGSVGIVYSQADDS